MGDAIVHLKFRPYMVARCGVCVEAAASSKGKSLRSRPSAVGRAAKLPGAIPTGLLSL